jgi:hypothetical protein
VTQQIELASMPLDDSYDGPRMEGARRAGRLLSRCPYVCLCAFPGGSCSSLETSCRACRARGAHPAGPLHQCSQGHFGAGAHVHQA